MFTFLIIATAHAGFLSSRNAVESMTEELIQETSKSFDLSDVSTLLGNMMTNFNHQMEEDRTNWDAWQAWSETQESDKNTYLAQTKSVQMAATSTLNSNQGQVSELTNALTLLAGDIAETRNSIAEVSSMRTSEHQLHEEELTDMTHTIEAVNHAITVLSSHYDAAQFAQVKQSLAKAMQLAAVSKAMNNKQVESLTKMMQDPNYLSAEHTSKDFAESASQGGASTVIETLKSLRTTLMENKQASIEKDNEARRQFEETKTAKETDLGRLSEDQAQKTNAKGEAESNIMTASAGIAQANADIASAEEYISLLTQDRTHFQGLYNTRLQIRNSEMAATQAAVDALREVSVGNAVAAIQMKKKNNKMGLLQAGIKSSAIKLSAVADKLSAVGKKFHSAELVQASVAVKGMAASPQAYFSPDAMNPVKDMLRQLIDRLEEEVNAETSHKEWCDTEKATSAEAKVHREALIDSLNAEIPQLNTQVATLTSEIAFCAAELTRNQAEATEGSRVRAQSKAQYDASKTDHDEVIGALDQAIQHLGGTGFSFVQVKASIENGNPFGEQSSAGSAGSAMDMLTDLLNRYTEARTELVGEENAAEAAHTQMLAVSEQFRLETEQTKQSQSTEKRMKEDRLADAQTEVATAGTELQQVTQYMQDLVPSCDDIRVSFEERKRRRQAEIDALKEAMAALVDIASAGR